MKWFELMNRINRRLGIPYSYWRIRDNGYIFRDGVGSLTPLIVYKEIHRGLYDVRLLPGETVLDIGAHVGMFSIPLAKENPDTNFICYEPNPANYLNLLRNIVRNKVKNIIVVNAGLAPTPCLLKINHFGWNTGGSNTTVSNKGVPAYPLSMILRRHNIKNIEVVKIDCEGGEFNGSILERDVKGIEYLVMEIHGHLGDAKPIFDVACKAGSSVLQVIESSTMPNGVYYNGKLRVA